MGSFFTKVLDDVFGIETQKKTSPTVSTIPSDDLKKEKEDIDKINEPDKKRRRTQAIRNVGGIRGQEITAVGAGTKDTLFGN
ncbi:MAG: hypothetical protein V3U75_13400 [Methylococcaceae bacterium]